MLESKKFCKEVLGNMGYDVGEYINQHNFKCYYVYYYNKDLKRIEKSERESTKNMNQKHALNRLYDTIVHNVEKERIEPLGSTYTERLIQIRCMTEQEVLPLIKQKLL